MEGLAPIDGWAILAIAAKATGYAAALLAMGGPLFIAAFRSTPDDVLSLARRLAVVAALIGLTVLALRFGIRAARISGMGLEGATDPTMLGFVWDSPLGDAALWRGAGEVLVLGLVSRGALGLAAGLLGAPLIAVSYTLVGHSLGDPRWALSAVLVAHLLTVAFWVGALAPLHRATERDGGAHLLHRFGIVASGTVAILIAAGVTFSWLMVGSLSALVGTAYGWLLLAKVAVVSGLMGLAALNRFRLVPAHLEGDTSAGTALRRSIRIEYLAVAGILVVTATLTSVTTPPVNM